MEKDADLALDVIEKYGDEQFEDRALFSVLSIAPEHMPEKGVALRVKLAKQNPDLLWEDIDLYQEIKNGFPEAVDLLQVVADADKPVRDKIYLPNEKVLTAFSEKYPDLVMEKLADNFFHQAEEEMNPPYAWGRGWRWDDDSFGNDRKLVLMVQSALSKLAQDSPELLLIFINSHHEKTPLEPELFIHAVEKLSIRYADQAITWLLSDFDGNAFEETSGEATKLSACQRVLERFSLHCSEELFRQLEEHLYRWSPSPEIMRFDLKSRLADRKSGNWNHFHAFRGQLQFMLLPHLDPKRISNSTRELIEVLKRKFLFWRE